MNFSRNFMLGRYCPTGSIIHDLDARVKILFLFGVSLSIFFIDQLLLLIFPLVLLIFLVIFSKLKPISLIKGIAPIIWLLVFSFVFHVLIPPRNISAALIVSARLVLLFSGAAVLTATTSNIELSRAVSWFARPLRIIGIDSSDVSLAFSLSLRFLPLIIEEAESVIRAQKSRSEKRTVFKKLESFAIVFMMRVLNKAKKIEYALVNRGTSEFDGKLLMPSFKVLDFLVLFLLGLYIAFVNFAVRWI